MPKCFDAPSSVSRKNVLYAATKRAQALRPDFFAYAELQGGSHDIIDEQPENWVRAIVDYLRA